MRHTRIRRWLALLILAAFALRLVYCSMTTGLGRPLPPDKYHREYVITARGLIECSTLVSPLILEHTSPTPSALMPPVYAGLVAGVYRLFGIETFAATLILQMVNAVATSLTVVFVFVIAHRLCGMTAAWIAACIATINPILIGYTTYMWDTSIFTLGVMLSVWMALSLSQKPARWRSWVVFGLFLGGLALLNPSLTITYPFLVLWPISKSHGWHLRPVLFGVASTVLGWLVVITPWTVRNYVHFGELMYIRSGFALELWLGVCPEADAHGAAVYRNQFPLLNEEIQGKVVSVGERAFIEECGERTRAAIAADPWRFMRLIAVRAVDYWAGTVFSHAPPSGGGWPRSPARAAVTLFLLGEGLVIVMCLLLHRKIKRDLAWLLAIVLSFSLVYCLTHVQVRFRAPVEPIMAVIVAALLVETIQRLWAHRTPPTGVGSDAGHVGP